MSKDMNSRQSHTQTESVDSALEEIWFFIEKDKDGYPESRTWEGLWARATPRGFEIQNVPFYLKNVSRGDFVKAEEKEFLRFTEVVQRGRHNTYRLLMQNASIDEVRKNIADLEERGLTVELNETGILLAVDVPPSVNQEEIDAYLIANEESGRWQMQDGFLNDIE